MNLEETSGFCTGLLRCRAGESVSPFIRFRRSSMLNALSLFPAMEDSHTIQLQLDEDKATRNAFFAVYDGHGGMKRIIHPARSALTFGLIRCHSCKIRWSERLQAIGT